MEKGAETDAVPFSIFSFEQSPEFLLLEFLEILYYSL